MAQVDDLIDELCTLVVAMETAMDAGVQRDGRRWSLDTPQLGVLISLDVFGPQQPGSIAALLGLTSGGVSKLIDRLERHQLVQRSFGAVPDDRRAVLVGLTDLGRDGIVAFDTVVRGLAEGLLDAVAPLLPAPADAPTPAPGDEPRTASAEQAPGAAPPITGPVLATLFRFVALLDAPIWNVVGDLEVLHPSDPRGLLVLYRIDRHGPLRSGDVPGLVGRSRAASARLVTALEASHLLARVADATDGRGVRLELTPVGRAIVRGVTAAVTVALSGIQPAMADLAVALGAVVDQRAHSEAGRTMA